MAAAGDHLCFAEPDGKMRCGGGAARAFDGDPHPGAVDLVIGAAFSCLQFADGTLHCYSEWPGELPPFDDELPALSVISTGDRSDDGLCGLVTDGEIVCYHWDLAEYAIPPGPFTRLIVDGQEACGIRANDEIECFGRSWNE